MCLLVCVESFVFSVPVESAVYGDQVVPADMEPSTLPENRTAPCFVYPIRFLLRVFMFIAGTSDMGLYVCEVYECVWLSVCWW